jgi:hypothetical protein
MSLDPHMYFCKTKRKQIKLLKNYINDFISQRDTIENAFVIKMLTLKIEKGKKRIAALEKGQYYSNDDTIFASDVKTELMEIKSRIIPLCEIIMNTMNLVLSKKELQGWNTQIKEINTEIILK